MDVKSTSRTLVFFVNGIKVEDDALDPDWTLLRYLRDKFQLPGTKLGCAEGGCGACTVMISKIDSQTQQIKHYTVNACLTPIGYVHGLAVTTVEGIGSTETRLHPVQERLAKAHGSQCGFCSPGFVMSMYTLLRNNPEPSMQEIEENLVGNLCRCTGYRPILEGFRTFSKDATSKTGCGKKDCCQLTNIQPSLACSGICEENGKILNENNVLMNEIEPTTVLFDPKNFAPYHPTQDIIFPPELLLRQDLRTQSLVFKGPRTTFFRCTNLKELLLLKQMHPQAKVVNGNTEVGIEVKFKNQHYPVIIHPVNVSELVQISIKENFLEIGAAVTLSDLEDFLKKLIHKLPDFKTQIIRAILEMLRWFAGRQIRNVSSVGGNIMTGSPISDLNPIFLASGATLRFISSDNEREIDMAKFYTGYRRNVSDPHEVLLSVRIPFTLEDEYFMAYKQSRRRDDDIAIVNCALKASFDHGTIRLRSISMAFGGMSATTILASNAMKALKGNLWDENLLEIASSTLLQEMNLDPSSPGGMIDYRKALTVSFFLKFYLYVRHELSLKYPQYVSSLNGDEYSATETFRYTPTKSLQFFENVPKGQERTDPIGRPITHLSAYKQTCGKATYIDDISHYNQELYAALVISTKSHAKIVKIDEKQAVKMEGVEGFFCARDLTAARNLIEPDEEIFASDEVHCCGQVIGIVLAKDQSTAKRASKLVQVQYEDLPNPLFTIEDAIAANSVWDPYILETGNVDEGFKQSDYVLEGEIHIGGQEHFYLETNVHIAIPHEDNEMEVFISTQNFSGIQSSIAKVLDIPENRVICRVKRLGGGFGGKDSRAVITALPVVIAAFKLKRPVRLMMDRDEDMMITGGRHPFTGRWKVGFQKNGMLVAYEASLYANAGCSLDLSNTVMQVAMANCDSSYRIPNIKIRGQCCRTNLPSNTAFRGFGAPQGMLITEDMISKVADFLQLDPKAVREQNLYNKFGEYCLLGQELESCTVRECWEEVISRSGYVSRRRQVDKFNCENKYRKRGLSIIPTKHAIGLGMCFLNQAGALVHIYRGGSVLVSHGGVEIGQGIHTKMIQVASRVLKIPMENIYIAEASTDKVPNTTATSASTTSDLNGMAVIDACGKIMERLKPYQTSMPKASWKDWVEAAYLDRVSLSATGFYRTPDAKGYNFKVKPERSVNYFCYGAAVSEVEIECLTGDHQVLRTDIVMDVGNSLNPAIDIGQIEGAFAQGYGLFTLEEHQYSPGGALLTKGPGAYKIPSIHDIPREFNVSLLRESSNPRAVYSSKAVGEPPLFLASSVFHAIREAVKIAKEDDGIGTFRFDSPATAERIRMACTDKITNKIEPALEGSFKPWSITV